MTVLEIHVSTKSKKKIKQFWDAIAFLADLMGLEIVVLGG